MAARNYWLKAVAAKPTAVVTGDSLADFTVVVTHSANLAAGNIVTNDTKCTQEAADVAASKITFLCAGLPAGRHTVLFTNGNLNGCAASASVELTVVAGNVFDQPPAESACKACDTCLAATQAFAKSNVSAGDAAAAVASKFRAFCLATPAFGGPASCLAVEREIAASKDGNLGRRPAALCFRLGACEPARGCIGKAVNETNTNETISAMLDPCTANGLVGGATVSPAPFNASLNCRADSDCTFAKTNASFQVCSIGANTPDNTRCQCRDGVDTCFLVGACTSFCSSQAGMISAHNGKVANKACATTEDCKTAGEECVTDDAAKALCFTLSCANATVTTTPCNATKPGLCLPIARIGATAAAFDKSRASIEVSLASAAVPGPLACADVLSSNTTIKLGNASEKGVPAARCFVDAAAPDKLKIALPSTATILKDDVVATALGQTALVDAMSRKPFNFSLALADCSGCKAPLAVMQAPPVRCCCCFSCLCSSACLLSVLFVLCLAARSYFLPLLLSAARFSLAAGHTAPSHIKTSSCLSHHLPLYCPPLPPCHPWIHPHR